MITVDADGNALPADFADIAERGEQTVVTRLMVDFDSDGYTGLDDISTRANRIGVERSLSTELPDEVRLATGYAAAQLSADLSGGEPGDETLDAAHYFTRGNTRSAIGSKERIRRPVVADIGYLTAAGPRLVRRFTGLTRSLNTSARNGTAALTALDLRERLRDTVVLIPTNGAQSGADGTWIVFQALGANSIAAGPMPRATGSQLWLPLYGSLNAVSAARDPSWFAVLVDGSGGIGAVRPTFRPGPYVLATDNLFHNSDTDTQRMFVSREPDDPTWTATTGRFEAWILGVPNPTTGITGSQGRLYTLYYNNTVGVSPVFARTGVNHDGQMFYATYDSSNVLVHGYTSSFTVPGDDRYHFVGVSWDHTAQRIRFRMDDRDETVTTAIAPAEVTDIANWIQVASYVSCSDIHVHGPCGLTEQWLAETVDVQAYLDQSTLQLQACVEDQPREAWELITEVAEAEQAVVYFDEAGIFRYRTRARLVDTAGQTVQRTLKARTSLLDLEVEDGIDQIRNIVQVGFSPVDITGVPGFVYTDTTQRVVAGRSFVDFAVSFSEPVMSLTPEAFLFSIGQSELAPFFDPYLVATVNSNYTDDSDAILSYSGLIRIEVLAWTTKVGTVRVTNSAGVPIYIVALGLKGEAAIVGNTVVVEVRDSSSVEAWGPQPLQINSTQWVQTVDVALSLAEALLGDLAEPRRSIKRMAIVGDPRLQLGDRTAIDYPARPELDGEYWLTAITDSVDSGGGAYVQEVALREATIVLYWDEGSWDEQVWG